MAEENGNSIEAKTPLATFKGRGLGGVLLVGLILILGFIAWTNDKRESEHELLLCKLQENQCKVDLDMWIHKFPQGQVPPWWEVPGELRACYPNTLRNDDSKTERTTC